MSVPWAYAIVRACASYLNASGRGVQKKDWSLCQGIQPGIGLPACSYSVPCHFYWAPGQTTLRARQTPFPGYGQALSTDFVKHSVRVAVVSIDGFYKGYLHLLHRSFVHLEAGVRKL